MLTVSGTGLPHGEKQVYCSNWPQEFGPRGEAPPLRSQIRWNRVVKPVLIKSKRELRTELRRLTHAEYWEREENIITVAPTVTRTIEVLLIRSKHGTYGESREFPIIESGHTWLANPSTAGRQRKHANSSDCDPYGKHRLKGRR